MEPWPHKKISPGGCHPHLQGYFASSRGESRKPPTTHRPQLEPLFMEAWLKGYDEHVEFQRKRGIIK